VTSFEQLEPAVKRAFDHEGPALVNVEIAQVINPVAEAAISRKLGSHG
jgi:thiamine pyrophosphate-dependent acetolactate synthase large subunit-like protein